MDAWTVEDGYVLRERHGRRNRCEVRLDLPLRHPLVQEREVGDLLNVLLKSTRPAREHQKAEKPALGTTSN